MPPNAQSDIESLNASLVCFTRFVTGGANAKHRLDATIALSNLQFAAKDLFDIEGWPTTAGAKFRESAPAAARDAIVVKRLRDAGAQLVGTTNMDEFAYGFVTNNAHYGITKNPFDTSRLAGGSSGGSAAAVAAGLVDMALGSDTNGSVRVPASLCGIYGLRPTFDAIPVDGVYPFVERLDTVGIFTRDLQTLRASFDVASDSTTDCDALKQKLSNLRVARLGGWFQQDCDPDANLGCKAVADALGANTVIDLETAEASRYAAFLITAFEGGRLHEQGLGEHYDEYDASTRERLLAGLLLPDAVFERAMTVSQVFERNLLSKLDSYDVLIAPATPSTAPDFETGLIEIGGEQVSGRAHLGLFTQPLSFSGVPILNVPLLRKDKLPLGVQLIARHGKDALLFEVAQKLEDAGVTGFTAPPNFVGRIC